jgi:preprotein translocase subunit SecF
MQLAFRGDVTSAELRRALSDLGYSSPDVVEVQGKPREYIVRVQEVSTVPSGFEARARTALSVAAGNLGIEAVQVSPGGERLTFRASGELDVPSVERALESAGVDVRGVTVLAREEAGLRYEARLASVGDRLTEQLGARLGERGPEAPLRVEWVGARAGEQLRESAGKALIYTLAFIMVYIAFRFDLRFAPAAIFALVHAVIVAAGVYVLLGREVNLTFVAALLTVIGYGVNDTVVVFDRIRENLGRMKSTGLAEIVNTSVSQNFSRTIMTGGSVMLSLAAFFVWGTPAIRDLSLALLIGIVTTTYASVLVAAPLTEWFDRRFFRRSKAGATTRPVRTG